MRRFTLTAASLLLALALWGCAARGPDGGGAPPSSAAEQSLPAPVPEGSRPEASSAASADAGPEAPDYTDPEVCQEIFLAPYGNLIYAEGWSSYEDLGPDTLFQFTVQKNYHLYMSKLNYAERYGPEWARIDPPLDENGWAAYPAGEVEATALAYFGAPAEYLRTAVSYDAEKGFYQMQGGGLGEEWWPKVLSSEREGDLLKIEYEVGTVGFTGEDNEGNPVEVPGRRAYSAVMTVELREDGGFQYRSVEVLPPEESATAG